MNIKFCYVCASQVAVDNICGSYKCSNCGYAPTWGTGEGGTSSKEKKDEQEVKLEELQTEEAVLWSKVKKSLGN